MRVILLGAPGAGKGTQAVVISQRLGVPHVASGDLFRQAQHNGSELGQAVRTYTEQGLLVPDEVTIRLILGHIAAPDCTKGFILDGFPRTLEQARALEGQGIDKALYIKVATEELLRRLSGRRICRQCQAPYHVVDMPPQVPGRCDRCGGELYQRPDDSEETVRKRIEVYLGQTLPLIQYYAKEGKLVEINGEQGVDGVTRDLLAALD